MDYRTDELLIKITEMYPVIAEHGVSVKLDFIEGKGEYLVTLVKNGKTLSTHLEKKDADECLNGIKCLSFGVQLAQLLSNFGEDTGNTGAGPPREVPVEYAGLDNEGYLINFGDWTGPVAETMAKKAGIGELTEQQLEVLKFIRGYYERYHYFPIVHSVCKNVHQSKGCMTEQFLTPLEAWKLAGLPHPDAVVVNVLEHGEPPT